MKAYNYKEPGYCESCGIPLVYLSTPLCRRCYEKEPKNDS